MFRMFDKCKTMCNKWNCHIFLSKIFVEGLVPKVFKRLQFERVGRTQTESFENMKSVIFMVFFVSILSLFNTIFVAAIGNNEYSCIEMAFYSIC